MNHLTIRSSDKAMSLYDYKINFNDCLGSGHHGVLYGVIVRPKSEQGVVSYLFPYVYDYFWRPHIKEDHATDFCIKIARPLKLDPYYIWRALRDFHEQCKVNAILEKHHIDHVELLESNSLLSSFRTRVSGKTFSHHSLKGTLYQRDYFPIRQALIPFLQKVVAISHLLWDIKADNVMYDEVTGSWKIIDAYVMHHKIDLKRIFPHSLHTQNEISNFVVNRLFDLSTRSLEYSTKDDKTIMDEVNHKYSTNDIQKNDKTSQALLKRNQYELQHMKWSWLKTNCQALSSITVLVIIILGVISGQIKISMDLGYVA